MYKQYRLREPYEKMIYQSCVNHVSIRKGIMLIARRQNDKKVDLIHVCSEQMGGIHFLNQTHNFAM